MKKDTLVTAAAIVTLAPVVVGAAAVVGSAAVGATALAVDYGAKIVGDLKEKIRIKKESKKKEDEVKKD